MLAERPKPLTFKVLFQDEHYVAIHKPPGILVHRTGISEDKTFVLQELRNQLNQRIYPVHRLDRGTAGVLIFGLSSESARTLSLSFEDRKVRKTYWAIVRGFVEAEATIDYPLLNNSGATVPATTNYRRLCTAEIPVPVDRYPQSRYSLVEIFPQTGRMHQIRKHFAHIRHPVIGDKKHGDRHHNRMFISHFDCPGLMLLARRIEFEHPQNGGIVDLQAEPEEGMRAMMGLFPLKDRV